MNGKPIPNTNKIFKLNWASFGSDGGKQGGQRQIFSRGQQQQNNDFSVKFKIKFL